MFKHVWPGWTLPVKHPLSHGVLELRPCLDEIMPFHAQIFTNKSPANWVPWVWPWWPGWLLNMAIEIVDFPIKHGDFPEFFAKLPEGIPNPSFRLTIKYHGSSNRLISLSRASKDKLRKEWLPWLPSALFRMVSLFFTTRSYTSYHIIRIIFLLWPLSTLLAIHDHRVIQADQKKKHSKPSNPPPTDAQSFLPEIPVLELSAWWLPGGQLPTLQTLRDTELHSPRRLLLIGQTDQHPHNIKTSNRAPIQQLGLELCKSPQNGIILGHLVGVKLIRPHILTYVLVKFRHPPFHDL